MDFKDELHTFITNWATKGLLFYIFGRSDHKTNFRITHKIHNFANLGIFPRIGMTEPKKRSGVAEARKKGY